MNRHSNPRHRRSEAGIALLISIFVLLLVSVVAIALLVSSGTESALGANYRSSTNVYYAALAGLEEARGRLLTKNPDYFNIAKPGFLPPPGTALPLDQVRYLTNPDAGVLTTYPDTEYDKEFNPAHSLSGATLQTVASVSGNNAQGIPGPLFKWVRINAVTEWSLNLDVDQDHQQNDSTTPLYYDGTHLNLTSTGNQALEITALAVLPNGSQKMVQYVVAPTPINLPPLLAALTLSDSSGNAATFHAPASNTVYAVKGDDQYCDGNPTGAKYPAIGVFMSADVTPVINGIPSSPASVRQNYTGMNNPAPDVESIGALFPASLQTPSQLDAIAQAIIQNPDALVPQGSNATQISYLSSLPMSPSNPMTVVANGDLDISNWSHDGYGLLLVTGTFTYDPDTTWNGIVLVIGQGKVRGSHMQFKQINGAMLVARTRDDDGNLLPDPNLGGASVIFNDSMQGDGIRYSSCWIQKATPASSFKVLSFREIPQLN